jgi:hypothetical protein
MRLEVRLKTLLVALSILVHSLDSGSSFAQSIAAVLVILGIRMQGRNAIVDQWDGAHTVDEAVTIAVAILLNLLIFNRGC